MMSFQRSDGLGMISKKDRMKAAEIRCDTCQVQPCDLCTRRTYPVSNSHSPNLISAWVCDVGMFFLVYDFIQTTGLT